MREVVLAVDFETKLKSSPNRTTFSVDETLVGNIFELVQQRKETTKKKFVNVAPTEDTA